MKEKKVLVVDDEAEILKLMKTYFEMKGYKVFTAKNAQETIKILTEQVFMLMFLDLRLPDMSGIELCKQLRKDNLIAIIYAITGYTNFYNLMDCRAAGFDDFFVKPLNMRIILKATRDAFEKIERWKVDKYGLI